MIEVTVRDTGNGQKITMLAETTMILTAGEKDPNDRQGQRSGSHAIWFGKDDVGGRMTEALTRASLEKHSAPFRHFITSLNLKMKDRDFQNHIMPLMLEDAEQMLRQLMEMRGADAAGEFEQMMRDAGFMDEDPEE